MLWRLPSWQQDELPSPVHLFCYPRLPREFWQAWLFTNVVNTSGRLVRCCDDCNRMRNVLHISSRAPPSGEILGMKYGGSPICDAFQQWEESMEGRSSILHSGSRRMAGPARICGERCACDC